MSKTQVNELPVAMERVEKAQGQLTNAKRRLSRAEEQVRTARSDVAEAEVEVKESTDALNAMIKRTLGQAMRKGGSSAAVALGEIISKYAEEGSSGAGSDEGGSTVDNSAENKSKELPLSGSTRTASE